MWSLPVVRTLKPELQVVFAHSSEFKARTVTASCINAALIAIRVLIKIFLNLILRILFSLSFVSFVSSTCPPRILLTLTRSNRSLVGFFQSSFGRGRVLFYVFFRCLVCFLFLFSFFFGSPLEGNQVL